jgi:predicted transcriptional regulator
LVPRDGEATRRALLQIVEQSRAIHKSELCRQVDRAWGTVGYHIRMLKKEGLIATDRAGGLLWVFPAKLVRWERNQARLLAEPGVEELVAELKKGPSTTVQALVKSLDLPTKTIRRHLSRLEEAEMVDRTSGRPQKFTIVAPIEVVQNSR